MKTYRIMSFDDRCFVDHAVEQLEDGVAKITLCGRKISGTKWFLRGDMAFDGKAGYYCKACCRRFKPVS